MAKSGAENIQKRDRQINRQTKNSTFFAATAAGEI